MCIRDSLDPAAQHGRVLGCGPELEEELMEEQEGEMVAIALRAEEELSADVYERQVFVYLVVDNGVHMGIDGPGQTVGLSLIHILWAPPLNRPAG